MDSNFTVFKRLDEAYSFFPIQTFFFSNRKPTVLVLPLYGTYTFNQE